MLTNMTKCSSLGGRDRLADPSDPAAASGFRFFDLSGRTLLITGVTRGIGRDLLPGLLDQGLNLIAVSRGREQIERIQSEIGLGENRLRFFECDLADPEAVKSVARKIAAEESPLDAILHNAASILRRRFGDMDEASWGELFQINLMAAATLTRLLLPKVRQSRQGRIVFTGSILNDLGGGCLSAYAASKGALAGLTRSLAHELKGTAVTVNCLIPGAIRTESDEASPAIDEQLISWQSVPRRLRSTHLLGPLCLLLSEAGEGISGQEITVDGGIVHPVADPDYQSKLM